MDFYEPTYLFRQNAIKRPGSDASSSVYSDNSPYSHSNKLNTSWLLNNTSASDVLILNKACSLDRLNIKSNYWKIPDAEMNLTAIAATSQTALSPLLAISSANTELNLFIYELDAINNYLTHHTTISLPNVHALAWVPNSQSRYLVSGNNKGYAHLVSIPLPESYTGESGEESAEIVKRFNHRKHLKLVNKDPSIFSHADTCVSKLGFTYNNKLVSIYDDTLFVWNMNQCELLMRPRPENIAVIPGICGFDTAPVLAKDSHTVALCGTFGISLFDTRSPTHNVPKSTLSAHLLRANLVKWSTTNEHVMAAAHGDGMVRLWDTRKQDTFACLTGHHNKTVRALEWNDNDLFTGASDGNIVHWDLTSDLNSEVDFADQSSLKRCSLKEGVASVKFNTVSNSIVETLSERLCGTLLPALNNNIVGMCLVRSDSDSLDCKIVSIDGSAFLGLHSKIYNAAENMDKQFYTTDDIALIQQEETSNLTLVGSSESLVKPLDILKHINYPGQFDLTFGDTMVDLNEGLQKNAEPVSHTYGPSTPSRQVSQSSQATDDFKFGTSWEDHESVLSVGSFESPTSLNSAYTLSTTATIIELPVQGHKQTTLLSFLDGELERICMDFQDAQFTSIYDTGLQAST